MTDKELPIYLPESLYYWLAELAKRKHVTLEDLASDALNLYRAKEYRPTRLLQ